MHSETLPVRVRVHVDEDYDRLEREPARLSAWAINLVRDAATILRDLPD
jgi:hypothetical protein